jgi:hypothetical protein
MPFRDEQIHAVIMVVRQQRSARVLGEDNATKQFPAKGLWIVIRR